MPKRVPAKKQSVLVTGGAGFIGSHLVDRLVAKGLGVRVLDDLSSGMLSNIIGHIESGRVEFVEGDVKDLQIVRACVRGVDAVVHLAAQVSVPYSVSHPKDTMETNVNGTVNLLNALSEEKVGKLGKFLFVSSCAVYGEPEYLPVDEAHLAGPISPYAESKLLAEKACLEFYEKKLLKTVVFRLFNVYGPRQGLSEYSGVITKFLDRIAQNLPLTVYGDGLQTRDFVYVSDVVDAFVCALERDGVEGEVFNIGTGTPITIQQLAETLLRLAKSNLRINRDVARAGDIKFSYANIAKATRFLDFKPKFTLKDGLQSLLAKH